MIDWNEDNFLEKLTPQLRQGCGGTIGPCPDAETLRAVIEGEARGPERDAVMEHLSRCAACAELRSRLLNFDNFESVSLPEPETVWNQTRTRLDNWLESFLHSEAARALSAKGRKPSRKFSGWESISNLFIPRKIVWAAGVAAVLVLIADAALWVEYKRVQAPQGQVAARATVTLKPPAKPALSSTSPERNLPTKAGQAAIPSAPNQAPKPVAHPRTPAFQPNAPPRTGPAVPPGESILAPPSPPINGASPPAIGHPPTIRLGLADRLLIVLSSISPKPDGSFQFHGTLLLAVAQPGTVPLNQGTEVIGVGTKSQGKTSLAVTEFVAQGARYTLKDGSGAMNAKTPGAVGEEDFDPSQLLNKWPTVTGRVLDMRPTAPAVYEEVSGQTGQPDPEK